MNTLANMGIGKKIGLALGSSIVFLILVGGAGLYAINSLHVTNQAVQRESRMIVLAESMQADLTGIETQLVKLLYRTGDGMDCDGRIQALREHYKSAFLELSTKVDTEDGKRALRHATDAIAQRREMYSRAQTLLQQGKVKDAQQLFAQTNAALTRSMDSAVEEMLKFRSNKFERIMTEAEASAGQVRFVLIGCGLIAITLAIISGKLLEVSISRPIKAAAMRLGEVAQGDVSRDIQSAYLNRGDEVGQLSKGLQKMIENWREVLKQITASIAVLSSSSEKLSANSQNMSDGSHTASSNAHTVAAAAEQMSANVMSVASGMEETTTNLTSVATATEQMTSTIGEIARNSEKARRITEEANRQAARVSEKMSELGSAAQEIGKVTETITEISTQTNLLALNATVEAARAGAAGKGFAVVATEIKELAQQTATATEDIKRRIQGVQSSTVGGIAEINKVSHVIREVSDIVTSIAAAIEEQSTVTRDIARNISEASTGVRDANIRVAESSTATREIAKEIVGVDHAASRMAEASEHIKVSASELSHVAEELHTTLQRFKV